MPYIQKYAPANCITTYLSRTYSGSSSDRFTIKQDLEPYCVEVSLAGQTAYVGGRSPNDNKDLTHWFTQRKIIAPYGATINNFQTVIEDGKYWGIDLVNDTIPDYNVVNIGQENYRPKRVYPTATGSGCYAILDSNNGENGYNYRASTPINATNWFNDSSYSISPSLTIERFYSISRFYRLRVYRNGILIDTIVTIGCQDKTKSPYIGFVVAPGFIFTGFSTDQCPPNTCSVDCGTYVCCYNSQGISVFNYNK